MALVVFTAATASAQTPDTSLTCGESAVQITIDRKPTLEFVRARRPGILAPGDVFTFGKAAFGAVRLVTMAMTGDYISSGGTDARLVVYVETAASEGGLGKTGSTWWELQPRERESSYSDSAANDLLFDSGQIAACAGREQCKYADIALASSDRALVSVSFRRDLGGANANNWTEARLLIDFSASPPRAAVTIDCDYNEGGGACTAISSGNMPRTTLACSWQPSTADFLCREEGDPGHRDFWLLSGTTAPPRPGELPSLESAAIELSKRKRGDAVIVHRLGPVVWLDDVVLPRGGTAMLLATGTQFLLAMRGDAQSIRSILAAQRRGILDSGGGASAPGPIGGVFTTEVAPELKHRELFRDRDLVVLQVWNAGSTFDGETILGDSYWVGIAGTPQAPAFDAIRLTGERRDGNCGEFVTAPSAAPSSRFSRPFSTQVVVQPTTSETYEEELRWQDDVDDRGVVNCRHHGRINWKDGRFVTTVNSAPCKAADPPLRVVVSADGSVRFEPFKK